MKEPKTNICGGEDIFGGKSPLGTSCARILHWVFLRIAPHSKNARATHVTEHVARSTVGMEPTPPPPGNHGSSALRIHPRTSTSLNWDVNVLSTSTSPHHSPQQRRHNAKLSPRHVKLQSVHVPAALALPVYAASTLRDQIHGQFRNELFQFHQLLHDACMQYHHCSNHNQQFTTGQTTATLSAEIQHSSILLEILTSDHHAAVLREFFLQWQRVMATPQSSHSMVAARDEQELLSQVVDTIFRNLPTILTEHDLRNAKSVMRLVDTLKSLRELILSLLYKTQESGKPDDDEEYDEDTSCSPSSGLFATTAALLETMGGRSAHKLTPTTTTTTTSGAGRLRSSPPKRIPLYLYCQQLEHEREVLQRRLRSLRSARGDGEGGGEGGIRGAIGLLSEQTVSLLVQFWELPRRERLAFFCQVASQGKTDDCDAVLQVFVGKCSNERLLSVWDTLQLTPHVQHAIALRKHGDDAAAAAREAAEALAEANEDRKQKHDKDQEDDDKEDDDHDKTRGAARRGSSVNGRGAHHRPSQRQVDLSGLADVFEDDEDDTGEDGDGDGWSDTGRAGGRKPRRRRKIRIRDRSRAPPDGHSSHHHYSSSSHSHPHGDTRRSSRLEIGSDNSGGKSRPGSKERESSSPPSSSSSAKHRPVLERTHSNLLELLKADDAIVDAAITDAAWKLVELIDRSKGNTSIVPRALVNHQTTINGGSSDLTRSASLATRVPMEDALGRSLTSEQQFAVKMDQLQSLLASLGGVALHTMTNDTIASVYKRMPALHRLFQQFSSNAYQAVGLDSPAPPTRAASIAITSGSGNNSGNGSGNSSGNSSALVPPMQFSLPPPLTFGAPQSSAPQWGDDQLMDSVELMLGKLGKMVRSLAPIADVRGVTGDGSSSQTESSSTGFASAEILKLAEAMEEIVGLQSGNDSSDRRTSQAQTQGQLPPRHQLSLDPAKRFAILSRLKSLAQGDQIENLTGLLTTTCDEIVTLKTVTEHQQQQLELLSNSPAATATSESTSSARKRAPRRVDDATENGRFVSDDDSAVSAMDDVIKNARKAKTRRASAARLAGTKELMAPSNDDDDSDDDGGNGGNGGNSGSGASGSSGGGSSSAMTASRFANRVDIPMNIKQATAQRGSKLFHVGILLRVVDQMYREHYETNMLSAPPQYGSRRMEFSEFMYDWHIRKYGLKSLAQQHLLKLIQSLRKYERKAFACHLCLRFLGIVRALGFHDHKFVLGLLDKWSGGTFSGATRHRVECAPRQFKIRVPFAIATIQEALSERFGVYFRTMDSVTARIKAQAIRGNSTSTSTSASGGTSASSTGGAATEEEYIKESDLLTIALDEWLAQRQRIEQILEAVYAAGDVNGDGSLEIDEFTAVMGHLSPSLDDKFVQRVFTAAHDYLKPRRISFARFVDVVLLERVLNTTTSSSSSSSKTRALNGDRNAAVTSSIGAPSQAAGSSSSSTTTANSAVAMATRRTIDDDAAEEEEEKYQFQLLEETWEQDKEIVSQALRAITHAATAASIQFRVTFLTQILHKRVDSKTAWMCHRQIMREIRRFQNMNEEQIVAVKTKEESFKKAVLAIRNMQRLGLAFKNKVAAVRTSSTTSGEDSTTLGDTIQDEGHGEDGLQTTTSTSSSALHKQPSFVSVVEGALLTENGHPSTLAEIEALEDDLRQKFLERADEAAIDDYKHALETIRRLSVQVFPHDLDLEQLRNTQAEQKERRERVSLSAFGGALDEVDDEEDEEGEDEEEEEEDEEDDEGEDESH